MKRWINTSANNIALSNLFLHYCSTFKKKSHAKLFRKSLPHIPEKYHIWAATCKESVAFPIHTSLPSCALNHRDHKSGEITEWKGARISQASFLENYLPLISFIDKIDPFKLYNKVNLNFWITMLCAFV